MNFKRVLGIDPGSHNLGVGCVDKQGNTVKLVYASVIKAPARDDLHNRLDFIFAELKSLVSRLSPEEVAIEDIFVAKNARSAFHLGMSRGVAIASCLGQGIKIFGYPPAQVKLAVTGHGRADKTQVKKMVELTLGTKISEKFDATDALAVALCHAMNWQANQGIFVNDRTTKRTDSLEKS